MKESTELAIHRLFLALKDEVTNDCVAVNIFFNSDGYELEYRTKDPARMKKDNVSMRNLRGDWVE